MVSCGGTVEGAGPSGMVSCGGTDPSATVSSGGTGQVPLGQRAVVGQGRGQVPLGSWCPQQGPIKPFMPNSHFRHGFWPLKATLGRGFIM